MAAVLEFGSVSDGRDDRRGRLDADALDPGDAPAGFVIVKDSVDLFVEGSDPSIEVSEKVIELRDCLAGHGGQLIVLVCQKSRGSRAGHG